jgi:hypothetical protein
MYPVESRLWTHHSSRLQSKNTTTQKVRLDLKICNPWCVHNRLFNANCEEKLKWTLDTFRFMIKTLRSSSPLHILRQNNFPRIGKSSRNAGSGGQLNKPRCKNASYANRRNLAKFKRSPLTRSEVKRIKTYLSVLCTFCWMETTRFLKQPTKNLQSLLWLLFWYFSTAKLGLLLRRLACTRA